MGNVVLWYESEDKIREPSIRVNFHLWTECGFKRNDCFFDVGVMLCDWSKVEKIKIFVPLDVDAVNVEDLGKCFKDPEMASVFFCDDLQVFVEPNKKSFLVKSLNGNDDFIVYCIDIGHDLEFETFKCITIEKKEKIEGTIISFNLLNKKIDKSKKIYVRFRIEGINFSNFVKKYSFDKHGLQSVFNTIYVIDFKFCDKMSINNTLLEKINGEKSNIMHVDFVNFFVITKTYVNFISTECKVSKLEENVWDSYVNLNQNDVCNSAKDLVAYRFNKEFDDSKGKNVAGAFESCDFFIKYKVERSIWWAYLLVVIVLGTIGSILANLLCKLLAFNL